MSDLRKDLQDSEEQYDFSKIQKKRRRAGPISETGNSSKAKKAQKVDVDENVKRQSTESRKEEEISVDEYDDFPGSSLTNEQRYLLELKKNNGLLITDIARTEFMVQDYSLTGMTLKMNKYCVVKRKKIQFADGKQWIWSCTCNRHFIQYYDGLPSCVQENFTDFPSETCMHINCVEAIVVPTDLDEDDEVDDHTYQSSSVEKSDVWGIVVNEEPRCVVRYKDQIGILRCTNGRLECLVCVYDKHECCHVKEVSKLMEEENDDVPEIVDTLIITLMESQGLRTEYQLKCLSSRNIHFQRREPFPEPEKAFRAPEYCTQCNEATLIKGEKAVNLYMLKRTVGCQVSTVECNDCQTSLFYDGCEDGILNMDKFLIHHEVLRQYMYLFVYARCSLHSYYSMWRNTQEDEGNQDFSKGMPYRNFRLAWYVFLKLLDIDYQEGFKCNVCGPDPEMILLDATSLGHRKIYQNWYKSHDETSEKSNSGR